MGSQAFGTPPTISAAGRVPGFEGAGVVSEVGARVDASRGSNRASGWPFFLRQARGGTKSSFLLAPWVPLPDSIPDEIGAQMLINTATALTAIRTAHDALPPDVRTGVVVLVTGAGSAVGRLLCKLLTDRGVKVIRLVRSEAAAAKLTGILPGSPIFATDVAGWKDRARAAAEGAKIDTAIDSVGGRLLGDIAELLAEGTGTVINFGSLGGETSDIRMFPPLHRHYPVSSVLRASPPPQRARPVPHGRPVDHPCSRIGASRVACAFLVYMLPPLPRCSGWAYSWLISPIRVSLPRKGHRVGLHIVLFEACSAFTRVAACTLARSPYFVARYPKASEISSPPCLLRLLPAGAVAG